MGKGPELLENRKPGIQDVVAGEEKMHPTTLDFTSPAFLLKAMGKNTVF